MLFLHFMLLRIKYVKGSSAVSPFYAPPDATPQVSISKLFPFIDLISQPLLQRGSNTIWQNQAFNVIIGNPLNNFVRSFNIVHFVISPVIENNLWCTIIICREQDNITVCNHAERIIIGMSERCSNLTLTNRVQDF